MFIVASFEIVKKKLETTWIYLNWRTDKLWGIHGILLSNEKKQTGNTHNMDESQMHYAK